MNTRALSILVMLLVTTLFIAPALATFVIPSKPGSTGDSFRYFNLGSDSSSFSYSNQWRNLDGINPNQPSTMANLASEIQNMRFGPSPQRPFGWTPYCTGG